MEKWQKLGFKNQKIRVFTSVSEQCKICDTKKVWKNKVRKNKISKNKVRTCLEIVK